ncbi:hypothetical protein [Dawidia soli]|uniref:Uncharacterized protein n=1 Tax=Dawidia soli TaxID=2782352 RepID=A0AAP2DIE7_9BACT|nr:hypothetical protein [Dawidia soli]MBT1689937.1 hypothetical protein [Dawidia soli]
METVTYTEALKYQLAMVRETANELAKEEPSKSVEQLLAEIKFVKELLDEACQFVD